MPTSGTTAFSLTAGDVVQTALEDNGVISLGETPTSDEMTACIRRLSAMLKSWQMLGVLWKQETIDVVSTGGVATIALPAYVREVNGARYVESATNERQMARWERDEYNILPNKASIGAATCYYVQRADDGLVLYIWPVPTAAATIRLDIDRAMDTVTADTETVDIPEELSETVYANLALRCSTLFGRQPAPELVARAGVLEQMMLDSYRPASYFLGGD